MPTLATTDATWVNDAAVSYDAGELRRADAALFAAGGIASGLAVTVDASDNVTVTAGQAVIDGESAVAGTGVYRGGIATSAVGALDARDATNARIDLVVFRQYDPDVVPAHSEYAAKVEVITGTPSASPSAPALPDLAVELARVTVPASGAGAATVNSANRTYARAVNADPGWITTGLTKGTNFTITSTRYRKVGSLVHLEVKAVFTGSAKSPGGNGNIGNETVLTLPAGFRPSFDVRPVFGLANGDDYTCVARLESTGALVWVAVSGGVSSVPSGTEMRFADTFLVD